MANYPQAVVLGGPEPAVNPMTTAGDLIVGGSGGVETRLAVGSESKALTVVSGLPAWTSSLSDSFDTVSVEWFTRNLLDSSAVTSVDYGGNRALYNSAGNRTLLWDAEERWTYVSGTPLVVEEWGRQLLFDGDLAYNNLSLDWTNRLLVDNGGLNNSLDWQNRLLYASNGSTVTLDWNSSAGPTTITQSPLDNSTKVATTAYVDSAVAAIPPSGLSQQQVMARTL